MKRTLSILALLTLGLLGGTLIESRYDLFSSAADVAATPGATPARAEEPELLYYSHPMDPRIHSSVPAKDSMGMDYLPVYAEPVTEAGQQQDSGLQGSVVLIPPETIQNLGVRTARVERTDLSRQFRAVGTLDYDEHRIIHLHPRTAGWIEHLAIKARGEPVRRGELLFELYSRELVTAQEEYLNAAAGGDERLLGASRERLLALGMADVDIARLARDRKVQRRVRVYAPENGVVKALGVREGMFVQPDTEVLSLADLSEVWVRAQVPVRHAEWVRSGDPVTLHVASLPERDWRGTVDYVYPRIERDTLTLPVRLRVPNPEGILRPGLFAEVSFFGNPELAALTVPSDAVIRTAEGARVIVAETGGRFLPRAVQPGVVSGGRTAILAGLTAGEQVVTAAQFLIDSEASLTGALARMTPLSENSVAADPAEQPAAGSLSQPREGSQP